MVALVDMVSPEGRIDETDVLNSDIRTIRNIRQSRTLRILVGTLRIPLAANPEFLPIRQAVTVDGPRSRYRKAVQTVGIHQGTEVGAGFALNARLSVWEVNYAVTTL